MRILSSLTMLAVCAPLFAADKSEDKAKEAAVALLKAVKAKDAAAAMKLSDVPFLYKDNGLATHKEAADLEKWLTEKVGSVKDADQVPTAIDELLPFAAVKEKVKTDKEKALVEEALGKDGFLAIVAAPDGKKVGIAVRIKDGKARIVGIIN